MPATKHPAGPFTVLVSAYRIAPVVDYADHAAVYQSRHRSARAAARRLASVIAGRSGISRDVRRCILPGYAGRYVIVCGDGAKLPLLPFRAAYCAKES